MSEEVRKLDDARHKMSKSDKNHNHNPILGGTLPRPSSNTTFEDAACKTIERMEDSFTKAATATQYQSEEDMLVDMLNTLESSGNTEDNISKMILRMMDQLTSEELLYRPMLELHQKLPEWSSQNETKIEQDDWVRWA